jgi:hypothetical protein
VISHYCYSYKQDMEWFDQYFPYIMGPMNNQLIVPAFY